MASKKIFIAKDETADDAIQKIEADVSHDCILVVPKNSALKISPEAFRRIREAAEGAGCALSVESVDEEILAAAKKAGIEGSHPFLGSRVQSLSDIIPVSSSVPKVPAVPKKKYPAKSVTEGPAEDNEEPAAAAGRAQVPDQKSFSVVEEEMPRRRFIRPKVFLAFLIPIVVAVAAVYIIDAFFAWAHVTTQFKKDSFTWGFPMAATVTSTAAAPGSTTVPAELFVQTKNTTQLYPATGRQNVGQKAKGQITVFNAYGTAPQTLVATTRFMTPNGLVYRLTREIIVPGATRSGGQLSPSSIDADVVADGPGERYNVTSSVKLTIPGFSGSPREKGFYGTMKSATGGRTGAVPVATDSDVAAARQKTADILKASLQSGVLSGRPGEFKILDAASDLQITKMTVNPETDENGNFSVYASATFRAVGFRENDIKAILAAQAQKQKGQTPTLRFENLDISYSNVVADLVGGKIQATVNATGTVVAAFSPDDFAAQIAGRSISDARSLLLAVPGLSEAKISVWPFWLGTLPAAPSRITVDVQ